MNRYPANEICEVCGAQVMELRRGRCWGCYSRWAEERPVGLGASCVVCGDRRRGNLKSIELLGAWLPCCHNCAARAASLVPMPRTIAAVRAALRRDRRARERRGDRRDARVFRYDRRTGERRRLGRPGRSGSDALLPVDDDMIVEITELTDELVEHAACDPGEMTRIIDRSSRS